MAEDAARMEKVEMIQLFPGHYGILVFRLTIILIGKSILKASLPRYLEQLVSESMQKDFYLKVPCKHHRPASSNPAAVALYGAAVTLLKSRNFRSSKTEQLGSSPMAVLMPLANH